MEIVLLKNIKCCKNKTAPQFGCTEKNIKKNEDIDDIKIWN